MKSNALTIEDLWPCLQGMIPAALSTCSKDGVPNVTYVSQVHYVDSGHVALSHQFFSKTHRNVREHPYACAMLLDPRTLQAYRLQLRFDHSETAGPLFESMSLQLQAIASHSGMTSVFRLLAADVYAVTSLERVEGFTSLPTPPPSELPSRLFVAEGLELLRLISERLNRCETLGELLETALQLLDERLGFRHTIILLADEANATLTAIASRGYPENGAGSEVGFGDGLIGMVARSKRALHLSAIDHRLRYARAVREQAKASGNTAAVCREIPLPGLSGTACQIGVPLVTRGRLTGVLVVESQEPLAFMPREDSLLTIIAAQLATGIEQLSRDLDDSTPAAPVQSKPAPPSGASARTRHFCFFHADDCVFVDGDYLIRNVPGRILWRLLIQHRDEGRVEFTNRELRMDPWLGLPEVKDNLESRLILLRKRLEQKCPDVRLIPRGRGRFALETDGTIALSEKAG